MHLLARPLWPLTTERLLVRPAGPADASVTWRYRRLPEVGEWITAFPPDEAGYGELFREPTRLARTLLVEFDGVVIGDLMMAIGNAWGQSEVETQTHGVQAEIGWAFDPASGGRGLATEAVAAMLRLAFEGLGLRRVFADSFAANERSWRLMERVGMRREAYHVADCLHRSGTWMDGVEYAILAGEWRAQQALNGAGTTASAPAPWPALPALSSGPSGDGHLRES